MSVPIVPDTLDEGSEIFKLMFWQNGSNLNEVKTSATATIVGIDLRVDANNDGQITAADDPASDPGFETAAPGRVVAVGELAETKVILGGTTALDGFQVKFTVADGIKVWTSPAKTQEIDGATVYVLGTDSLPGSVYVEGLTVGAATLQAKITDPDNVVYKTDSVRYTVFDLNIRTDSNNDGALTPADDDVKDEKAKRIFVNKDDDGKNGKPDYDPDEPFSAEEDDLAVTSLMLKFPADMDFTGIKARLTLDGGIKAWKALEGPGPKQPPVGATANGNIYEWDLGVNPWPSSNVAVWIEGLEIGPSTAKFELIIGGVVRRTDTVKYSVEEIVWPSNETEPADINHPNNWASRGTEHWKGFVLGKGWWIEKSLTEIINGDTGSIRTKYPEEKEGSPGVWQGIGQFEDTYIAIPKDAEGNFLDSFTINVSYEFENAPDGRSMNNFVDTKHPYLKPGFFCNSGIKIDGKTEVQIFDSASLLAAVDDPLTPGDPGVLVVSDDVPPAPNNRVWARYDDNGSQVYLALSEGGSRPEGWDAENFSALINGVLYNVPDAKDENDNILNMNSRQEFVVASSAGSMSIHVVRRDVDRDNNSALYDVKVVVGGRTYKYADVPGTGSGGPGAAVRDAIELQSHWGSGVKFTAFTIQ